MPKSGLVFDERNAGLIDSFDVTRHLFFRQAKPHAIPWNLYQNLKGILEKGVQGLLESKNWLTLHR